MPIFDHLFIITLKYELVFFLKNGRFEALACSFHDHLRAKIHILPNIIKSLTFTWYFYVALRFRVRIRPTPSPPPPPPTPGTIVEGIPRERPTFLLVVLFGPNPPFLSAYINRLALVPSQREHRARET
jgi:hypothetical protein